MLSNRNLTVHIDPHLRLSLSTNGLPLAQARAFLSDGRSDLLGGSATEFQISGPETVQDAFGKGQRIRASALFHATQNRLLAQRVTLTAYEDFPDSFAVQYEVENRGAEAVTIQRFAAPLIDFSPWLFEDPRGPWTLQGAAVTWGQDFAFPVPEGFEQDNYLGHLEDHEGGGIPMIYAWNPARGLALAHIEPKPYEWYMPVQSGAGSLRMALEDRHETVLQPGQSITSLRALIALHEGDFFNPLVQYREILGRQGLVIPQPNAEDFEPAWCSWGYEEHVLPSEMTGVLPKVAELNIRWLTLDDRWFDHYSDWNPRPDTFPGGEEQMRQMVDEIHKAGAYAQIWWYPLAVENGGFTYGALVYDVSAILRQHPDWLILNEDGSWARNNRSLGMLCPAVPEVQEHIRQTTLRFIRDWGFDGHKLDNIYTVPACHNPAHHHKDPLESVWALADVYRIIFETTRQLKPYSVTQLCPCGTPPTFSLLPYFDQSVTADPTSSLQIRQRTKFYKALLGPRSAVFADHVELADEGIDFASEIGTGGIPATKFVWPEDEKVASRLEEYWAFTPEKEALYRPWFELYNRLRLSEGEYLNLYDLAYDLPEAHAIRKDGRIYYAFFTPCLGQHYSGTVTLRGLEGKRYQARDYVHNRLLGEASGPEAEFDVEFESSLLVEVISVP